VTVPKLIDPVAVSKLAALIAPALKRAAARRKPVSLKETA